MKVDEELRYEGRKYTIRAERVECENLINVYITNKRKEVIGRALLTMHAQKFNGSDFCSIYYILADIIIYKESDRHKGIGSHIMMFLTSEYSPIITYPHHSTAYGKDLCKKFGFELIEGKNGQPDVLAYVRKEQTDGNTKQ